MCLQDGTLLHVVHYTVKRLLCLGNDINVFNKLILSYALFYTSFSTAVPPAAFFFYVSLLKEIFI